MSIEHTLSFQLYRLIQAGDLEIFSKQINKLNTFSEMTQAWPFLRLCLHGQMSSHVLNFNIMF